MKKIEFIFETAEDAQPFVIMLMQSGICELTMHTSMKDYSCNVTYEIDTFQIDPQEAVDLDIEFLTEQGISHISHQII